MSGWLAAAQIPVERHNEIMVPDLDAPLIPTRRLILRLPGRGDEGAIARYYIENRQHLQPYSPTFDEDIFSLKAWRARIDATMAEYLSGRSVRLLMLPREGGRVVGVANFTSITGFPSHLCHLGYSIAVAEQGKGLATEALAAAIEHVFTRQRLHRIEANYMPRNLASARVLEKLGFVIEGHARDYLLIDGRWEDHVRTSRTNPDWSP